MANAALPVVQHLLEACQPRTSVLSANASVLTNQSLDAESPDESQRQEV